MKSNQLYLALKSLPLELWWQPQSNWQQSFSVENVIWARAVHWCKVSSNNETESWCSSCVRLQHLFCSRWLFFLYFLDFACRMQGCSSKIHSHWPRLFFRGIFFVELFCFVVAMHSLLLQPLLPFIVLTIFCWFVVFLMCCVACI